MTHRNLQRTKKILSLHICMTPHTWEPLPGAKEDLDSVQIEKILSILQNPSREDLQEQKCLFTFD